MRWARRVVGMGEMINGYLSYMVYTALNRKEIVNVVCLLERTGKDLSVTYLKDTSSEFTYRDWKTMKNFRCDIRPED
jgi:hypothetical protein